MDPNSPIKPQQEPTPSVPNVQQAPAPPLLTVTSSQEAPKINGVSVPAGANKKPESPTQRSEKINAASAPKSVQQKPAQELLHKPVTMEEVEEYRRKSAKKKKTILASILLFLVVCGITTVVIIAKNRQKSYQELSSFYNDNIPIVIQKTDGSILLISQNGKTLSDKYDNIDTFQSDRSLATKTEEDKTISVIIDENGQEKYSTGNNLMKINYGQNYIVSEEDKNFLLNKDGQKVDERPLVDINFNDEQKYFLVANDTKYAIINAAGSEKITGTIDNSTLKAFSYGYNKYDENYYCAIVNTHKHDSKLYIYNCENSQEITNIEDIYYSGGFERTDSAFLTSEKGSSYFYNNEMIYNSDTQDTEYIGGIIKKAEDERFFNPITRKTTESFPNDTLIKQDKLSEEATIPEECSRYEKREASKLIQICDKIYYDNKSLNLNHTRYDYYIPKTELDDFLAFNNKSYIYRINKSNEKITIFDAKTNTDVYTDIEIQYSAETPNEATSRFIVKKEDGNNTVIDLATGKSATYNSDTLIRLETNYYIVIESTNTGSDFSYFNANHKEIYKEES